MSGTAYLALENGMVFEGKRFGAQKTVTGELVFTTGMTGYLETITDKSCYGQLVLQTFPLIGNYGVIPADFESGGVWAGAYIVKSWCQEPSNFRSEGNLDAFFKSKQVVGLCDVDTRALTKLLRENGSMNARILDTKPTQADFDAIKAHVTENAVASVSVKEVTHCKAERARYKVAMLDLGAGASFKREFLARDCDLQLFPHDSAATDILEAQPDGIVISDGPEDAAANGKIIEAVKALMKSGVPVFGAGLGHQLMALASGFQTYKLKHGHRGANQPVKDLQTGRVYITAQNHGYAVVSESIDGKIAAQSLVNLNDRTCEGIAYKGIPAFSAQFCPKSCGGPVSTAFLLDAFTEKMEGRNHAVR